MEIVPDLKKVSITFTVYNSSRSFLTSKMENRPVFNVQTGTYPTYVRTKLSEVELSSFLINIYTYISICINVNDVRVYTRCRVLLLPL